MPGMEDVPKLDIHSFNRPDLPSVGGGETPIIAIAPAIANAVYDATGVRIRIMSIRGDALKEALSNRWHCGIGRNWSTRPSNGPIQRVANCEERIILTQEGNGYKVFVLGNRME